MDDWGKCQEEGSNVAADEWAVLHVGWSNSRTINVITSLRPCPP